MLTRGVLSVFLLAVDGTQNPVRSKKMLSNLLKPYESYLAAKDIVLKEGTMLSRISKAKAKGYTAADVLAQNRTNNRKENGSGTPDRNMPLYDIDRIVAEIYHEYERSLRRNNSLDFDDLLLFGVKLFSQHEKAVNWCRHVLVDELSIPIFSKCSPANCSF
jgi:DNA helicase-2/ATP-dependent DNA helicase PcrA